MIIFFASFVLVVMLLALLMLNQMYVGGAPKVAGQRGRVRTASRFGPQAGYSLRVRRAWHATPMRSSGWSVLLRPAIYNFFEVGRKLRPSILPMLFNVQDSDTAVEENVGIGGVSPDAFDNFKNSGKKSMVGFDRGWIATYTHEEYVVQFQVERKLIDDDKYGVIGSRARRLGIAAQQKMDNDGANLYNRAFNSSYTGPDAVALCSASHPKSPTNATTQSNRNTLALTKANVSTVRQAMMAQEDDAGNILGIEPDTLVVPPELEDVALEIANSLLDPTSGNNAINPQYGRWKVQVLPRLTDATNWFMADSVWRQECANWYNRVLPNGMPEITLVSETSTEAVWDVYMRYSYGWDDWRWIYGNEVAGS
jgi:hypothetical protein